MATQFLSVSVSPGVASIGARGADLTLTAVGDAVTAALAVNDIDTITGAEDAISAILTAATAAKPAGNVVVSFDDEVITSRNQLRRALEAILRDFDGSNLLE